MDDIANAIREFIGREFASQTRGDISDDTRLIDDGIIDSLGIFVLVEFLETEFNVKLEPVEIVLDNFATVGTLAKVVAAKRRAVGSGVRTASA